MTLSIPVAVSRLISDVFATAKPQTDFLNTRHYYSRSFTKSQFRLIGMVGEACLPSNAYFLYILDYTPLFWVYFCQSEHF